MYYLILCEIPVFGNQDTNDNLVWVEIRAELPEEPCAYYHTLLTSTDKDHLVKYARLHNYNLEGE